MQKKLEEMFKNIFDQLKQEVNNCLKVLGWVPQTMCSTVHP